MEIGFTYGPCNCAPYESPDGDEIAGSIGEFYTTKMSAARGFLSAKKTGKIPRVHYVDDGVPRHITEVWVDGEKRG